jgi:PAS domain S-box-containing protein
VKALIIEDDRATRHLLVQVLSERGHDAVACENAEQAMRAVRSESFPLIVLDLLLPGVNGWDFIRWLRAQPQGEAPYVLVETVRNQAEDLAAVLQAGANDYLAKPYDLALLKVRLTIAERELTLMGERARRANENAVLLAELRHQQQRLDDLLANVPGIVWESWGRPDSAMMRVDFVSLGAERLLGYSVVEWLRSPNFWYAIMHPDDRVRSAQEAAAVFDRGTGGTLQFRWLSKSGQTIWIEARCLVTSDAAGKPVGLRGVALDVTERHELEAKLRAAQKLETVGQLAGGVAHGFNNLLTIIRGYTSLLEPLIPQLPALDEPLRQITAATDRAAELTRQLLAFSRRQMMQPRAVDLQELVERLTSSLQGLLGQRVTLRVSSGPGLPRVNADPALLEQALLALAANARDAMPDGGQLTLSLAAIHLDGAAPGRNPEASPGNFVCLTVADTGCGMDSATLSKVFEPFFTTKEIGQGTGLGLASVYGVIKQHRGWIEVTSQVGAGTTFKIFLPALEPVGAAPVAAGPERALGRGARILLVEDEGPVRELAKLVLEQAGFTVWAASSGADACRVFEEQGGQADLLFTDMVMPDGMTGGELAEQLRARKPDLKVIYTSGYTAETFGPEALFTEEAPFLPKPYTPQLLVQTIQECLAR